MERGVTSLTRLALLVLLTSCVATADPDSNHQESKCFLPLDRNPDHENASLTEPAVLYYQVDSTDKMVSSLRYVWSVVGTPTLFFSITPSSVNLSCNESANNSFIWTDFNRSQSEGSAEIPGFDGNFSFAIVFTSLIEYRDQNARAEFGFNASELTNTSIYRRYSLDNTLDWRWRSSKNELIGRNTSNNFTWTIKINVPTASGRLPYFPKYLYTNTSTTFDFIFQDFKYSSISHRVNDSNVKYGRLVLEMKLVHGPKTLPGHLIQNFSLDDEYTPSVFETHSYLFGEQPYPGYLQWKPISYLSADRKSTSSQQANLWTSGGEEDEAQSLPGSLASALFGRQPDQPVNVTTVYLIFGTEGDDNNMNPAYLTWTAVLGYGSPQYDTISVIVIITIIIGLGLPIVLIAVGAVFMTIKKKPWQNIQRCLERSRETSGYTVVNNQ